MSRKRISLDRYIDELKSYAQIYGNWEVTSFGYDSEHNYNFTVNTEVGKKEIKIPMYEDMYFWEEGENHNGIDTAL